MKLKHILLIVIFSFIVCCSCQAYGQSGIVMSDWAKTEVDMPLEIFDFENFQNDITREEFCEVVCKILDEKNIEIQTDKTFNNPFADTKNPYVIRLYNLTDGNKTHRIIYGKNEELFAPNDFITREEAVTILFRIYWWRFPDIKLNKRPNVGVFLDEYNISEWAYTPVYYMASKGIEVMVGNGENYCPKNNITIEQSIIATQRMCNLIL